jgi:hypothetical protein
LKWSFSRHKRYQLCEATGRNFGQANRPFNSTIVHYAATGIIVHRILEQLLADRLGESVREIERSTNTRQIRECMGLILQDAHILPPPEGQQRRPPKPILIKQMVRNGLRLLSQRYPLHTVYCTEMIVESDDAIGIIDLVLNKPLSVEQQEFVLIDWKTRDARPMSTNEPQLAVYTVLLSEQYSSAQIKSCLALLHPRQATLLDVNHHPDFLEQTRSTVLSQIEHWRTLDVNTLICTCGNCD